MKNRNANRLQGQATEILIRLDGIRRSRVRVQDIRTDQHFACPARVRRSALTALRTGTRTIVRCRLRHLLERQRCPQAQSSQGGSNEPRDGQQNEHANGNGLPHQDAPIARATRKVINAANHASANRYPTMIKGQRQELVSRRTIDKVEMHCGA